MCLVFHPLPATANPLPSHSHYQMRHRESIQHQTKEGGQCRAGRYDPEGGQERKRLGGEAFAGGGDEGRDGIPCGEPASEALGACGINHGREEHPKLRDDRNAAPHIAIEASQGSERQADGETSEQKRGHGHWKEKQICVHRNLPKNQDSDHQNEPNEKVKHHHVKTSEQDGLTGKVDFCQHGLGGVEGIWRAHDRVHEDLPEQRAQHGKGGIGNPGAGDGDDALGIQENKGHRGHKRRQERPDVAEECLTVLCAEVADEQPPGKFTPSPYILGDRSHKLGGMAEQGLG